MEGIKIGFNKVKFTQISVITMDEKVMNTPRTCQEWTEYLNDEENLKSFLNNIKTYARKKASEVKDDEGIWYIQYEDDYGTVDKHLKADNRFQVYLYMLDNYITVKFYKYNTAYTHLMDFNVILRGDVSITGKDFIDGMSDMFRVCSAYAKPVELVDLRN